MGLKYVLSGDLDLKGRSKWHKQLQYVMWEKRPRSKCLMSMWYLRKILFFLFESLSFLLVTTQKMAACNAITHRIPIAKWLYKVRKIFSCPSRPRNYLPVFCFPVSYDLQSFKMQRESPSSDFQNPALL